MQRKCSSTQRRRVVLTLLACTVTGRLLRAQAFVVGGGTPIGFSHLQSPARSDSHSAASSTAAVKPLFWHPGADENDLPAQQEQDDFFDESTYQKKWRKRRLNELLQYPDLHPGLVNELLAPDYLERQRQVLAPNEAFGAIFQLDVVTDVAAGVVLPVWTTIAKEYKHSAPTAQQCQRAMGMLPEVAIMREFRWTQDFKEAKKMTLAFAMTMQEAAAAKDYSATALPGAVEWLTRLQAARIPCAVVSRLPEVLASRAIEQAGLAQFFTAQVAAEDSFERDLQGFLKATLKIGRPPSKCAVFDCRPAGMIQAHEAEFKGVGVIGLYPIYELGVADLLKRSLGELHVADVRRLFSDKVYEPELQLQRAPVAKRSRPVITRTREEVLGEMEPQPEFAPRPVMPQTASSSKRRAPRLSRTPPN